MKQLWTILVVAFCTNVEAKPQENLLETEAGRNIYSARYDNLNTDTILNSPRLVTNYVECLLNKKPCPPEGKDLKRVLPEALRTKCSRCSQRQKEGALKVIRKLYYSYPFQYNALREKWDPTGEYHRRFLEYIQEEQFNQIDSNLDRDQTKFNEQPVNRVELPTQPPTRPPTRPPTQPPTRPPTQPPTRPPTQPPTRPPTQPPTRPPTQPPTRPPTTTTRRPPPPPAPATTRRQESTTRSNRSPTQSAGPAIANRFGGPEPEIVRVPEILPQASNLPDPSTVAFNGNSQPAPANALPHITQRPQAVADRFADVNDQPLAKPSVSTPGRPYIPPTAASNNNNHPFQHLINNFFVPPNQQNNQPAQGPIAGIINEFGKKVSRTTEAIVDMIQNTARIISGVKQQHHQNF